MGVWVQESRRHNLDPVLLYSVALRESRRMSDDGLVRPHPWTLNGPNGGEYFESREKAEEALTRYINAGYKNIDVGWMQVNILYNGDRVNSPIELLDPAVNTRVGAEILAEGIANNPEDIVMGVGRYNAGYSPGSETKARSYGKDVMLIYRRILKYLE